MILKPNDLPTINNLPIYAKQSRYRIKQGIQMNNEQFKGFFSLMIMSFQSAMANRVCCMDLCCLVS